MTYTANTNDCSSCVAGYSGTTCTKDSCADGSFDDGAGGCTLINIDNCKISTQVDTCTTCLNEFSLFPIKNTCSSTLDTIPTGCSSINSNGECTGCLLHYHLVGTACVSH